MHNCNSLKNHFHSQRGFTLIEVIVALLIVCLFTVAFTQFIGINYKDIFNQRDKMQATALAQNLMEKVTAIVENNDTASLGSILASLDEYVTAANLLVYDANKKVRFCYRSVSKNISDSQSTSAVAGIDINVVVFYNHGASYVRIDNFIITE